VKAAGQDAGKRLTELGYEVQSCLVDLGKTAENVVSDILSRERFDCIMIVQATPVTGNIIISTYGERCKKCPHGI
jgi:hypothetical protein